MKKKNRISKKDKELFIAVLSNLEKGLNRLRRNERKAKLAIYNSKKGRHKLQD